jgi:hypothetical protein
MIPMTPEQAAFLLQYNLPSVKNEYRTTSGIIAAIPTSNVDYRPDPQARSAAEIAWHVAAAEHRFYGGIVSGAFDFNAIPRPEGGLTRENILKWYADSFAKNFDSLTRLTPSTPPASWTSAACSSCPPSPISISPSGTLSTTADSSPPICPPWAAKSLPFMEKVTIPPKPKKPHPPTDLFQLCARVPATGKNATPHRNIFSSGNSAIFTTRAAT